jgi:predicted AlkP superfamily pyrophosphatase or phosphodiesterase
MTLRRLASLLCAFALCSLPLHAQQPSAVIDTNRPPNAAAQEAKHYVVLVSLDGFRYDYAQKYDAKHLQAIAKEGASAPDGMIPSYPSITFPNHYTLVTGLYPEHHGIVANSFYDPVRKARYSYSDATSDADGSWYGGTPLWVLAEQQQMRAACFFWPGSEAAIQGIRPSYYLHFDNKFPDEKRIAQVIDWLKLPPEQRPHFITLYYYEPDHSGHNFGPDSPEVGEAVHHVDDLVGKLHADLDALHLPIDLIVVSDHGMAKVDGDWITLDKYTDLTNFDTDGALLYPKGDTATADAEAQKAYDQLKKADSRFMVYRRAKVPAALDFNQNPREGDPVIVPTGPYIFRAHAPTLTPGQTERPAPKGMHGYDPATMKEMRAVFYAVGPDIRPGVTLKPFENVNVYPLIAHILGLDPPKVDGNLNVLSGVLVGAIETSPQSAVNKGMEKPAK